MPVFKCKMCGGDLIVEKGSHYGTCAFCGSVTTFPCPSSQEISDLYSRAEQYRVQGDFSASISAYEKLLSLDASEAEAHWGIVLSRFGIEYVKDPATGERIPTCHRVQYDSILADDDYMLAISLAADDYQKELYKSEAERIAAIQKKILEISAKEEPFDIFICYKETGDNGERTPDSVIAQEVYEQLTDRGFKVFFARITLEGKLGSDYEAVIFAALNSAKVMLTIGSCQDYFNSTWVKNEWSRFIALQKHNKTKQLIPCVLGDVSLPRELSAFQTQNLNEPGVVQELVRGLKKIIDANSSNLVSNTINAAALFREISALEKKTKNLMSLGDYTTADECCDKILVKDPTHVIAYLYKFFCECHINDISQLLYVNPDFGQSQNLKSYLKTASSKDRNAIRMAVDEWQTTATKYARAQHLEEQGAFAVAVQLYAELKDYRDSKDRLEQLAPMAYEDAIALRKRHRYQSASRCFELLGDYCQSQQYYEECYLLAKRQVIIRRVMLIPVALVIILGVYYVYSHYLNFDSQYNNFTKEILSDFSSTTAELIQPKLREIQAKESSDFAKSTLLNAKISEWRELDALIKKADSGNTKASSKVGFLLLGEKYKDYKLASHYLEIAANAGDKTAIEWLAKFYENGLSEEKIKPNKEKAAQYYYLWWKSGEKKMAKKTFHLLFQENPDNIVISQGLSDFYLNGIGIEKNEMMGYYYTKKYCMQLAIMANNLFNKNKENNTTIQIYAKHLEKLYKDYGKAYSGFPSKSDSPYFKYMLLYCNEIKRLEMEAKKGNSNAALVLGDLFFQGKFWINFNKSETKSYLQFDPDLSYKYYALSSSKSHIGKLKLANCYLSGIGCKFSPQSANKLYKNVVEELSAKDKLSSEEQYCLGYCLVNGLGVTANRQKAFNLFSNATDSNYPPAIGYLGYCYQNGLGCEKDIAKAISLYNSAIKYKEPLALRQLGILYYYGIGVRKGLERAKTYWSQAVDAGDVDALYYLAKYEQDNRDDVNDFNSHDKQKNYLKLAEEKGSYAALVYMATQETRQKWIYLDKLEKRGCQEPEVFVELAWMNFQNSPYCGHIGLGMTKDKWAVNAFEYLSKAYRLGTHNKSAMAALAHYYRVGFGCDKNHKMSEKIKKEFQVGENETSGFRGDLSQLKKKFGID